MAVLRKKKIWASFQRIIELFTLSLSSKKYVGGNRDPEKNLFRITDLGPGVKKAPDPDPQHWKIVLNMFNVCSNVAITELRFNIYFCVKNFRSVVVPDPVGSASFFFSPDPNQHPGPADPDPDRYSIHFNQK
jgi:hypothetical protein